jgi:hypothetical protein
MKRILSLALAFITACAPLGAQAAITGQVGIAGTQAVPVAAAGIAYANYAGSRSTLLVIKGSKGILGRVINTNTSAQTATFTCYDNASAASGTVLYAAVLAASQVVDVEVPATNGVTCVSSAAILSGNGINVTYY